MKTILLPSGENVFVSDDDYEYLSKLPWKMGSNGYPHLMITMHELIWWLHGNHRKKGHHVHHVDDNKLNNQRDNLVALSRSDHLATRPTKGWIERTDCRTPNAKRFHAQIKKDGKIEHLGHYYTAEEAQAAYLKRKAELFPDINLRIYPA